MASLKEVANLASVSLMTVSRAINNPDQLLAQRPDGIIFTSMGLRQVTIPERLRDKNIVLANCVSENHSIPSYIPDDFDGQYQAMEVLLRRGYQRPLCIYLPECTLAGKARRAGAEKAWQESALPLEQLRQCHLAWGDEHYQDVISLLDRYCPEGKPLTGQR